MKKIIKPGLLAALLAVGGVAFGQPAKPAKPADTKPVPARSVFTQPLNAREGRDPFFPESTRPFETAAAASGHVVEIPTLFIKGFSGTPGHYLIIINNHTFAAGDEGDVTAGASRIHIRCIEIKPNTVLVEANGQQRELKFSTQ
ncbi:MAG TPA: hypothetical protein VGO57_03495 [Verrucomicrobiae bacterium]|jgi:hypothetical protein